jgi:putative MATE family efflux protein
MNSIMGKIMEKTQYEKMTASPVNKLIISLAVPTVISMLITNVYNLVDAYFVGRLGTSASGAIGIVLAVQAIIQAFGFTLGHGAGSISSRKLGQKDAKSASGFASTSFFFSLVIGFVIAVFGLVFLAPLMHLLGSTPTILPYAKAYAKYILLAAPFFAGSCVLNNLLRYEGKAMLAMVGLTAGAVLNMIGDPILMFGLNMGVDGAGLSTALSQTVSFLILLYMFLKKAESRLSVKNIIYNFKDIKDIVLTGLPSLIRQGLNSISVMALNLSASVYGDAAIAAMSIVGRITMFIASVMIGIGQGLQPVAAFNFGAKKYTRVRQAFTFTLTAGEALLSVFALIGFILAPAVVTLFRDDPLVVAIGAPALRYQCVSLLLQPLGVCTNMTFQSIGESKKAVFVSLLRSGLYFLPIVMLLPRLIGLAGIESAQAIADSLTFLTALPMILSYFKKLPASD